MPNEFVYLVCEGNVKKYKNGWSKWRTPEEHEKNIKAKPNYELIRPNKLCLETDYPQPETNKEIILHVKKLLDEKHIAYKIYFTGSKSYHCESEWQGLEKVDASIRPKTKKALAEHITNKALASDFDEANFGNKRMFHIPYRPHRKTGTEKILLWETKGANTFPEEILKEIKTPVQTSKTYDTTAPTQCNFLEYCLENKICLDNKQQNSRFSPNAFGYFKGKQEALKRLVAIQDQPNLSLVRLNCWKQYNPEFNCKQVQAFAGTVGKRSICDLCLLGGKK